MLEAQHCTLPAVCFDHSYTHPAVTAVPRLAPVLQSQLDTVSQNFLQWCIQSFLLLRLTVVCM